MRYALTSLAFCVLTAFIVTPNSVHAEENKPIAVPEICEPDVAPHLYWELSEKRRVIAQKYQPFGTNIPILLVHGMNGHRDNQWGAPDKAGDFANRFIGVNGTTVAAQFDYGKKGVIYDVAFDRHVRPLADAIDCFARISLQNGGVGKVVVVAYSEGSALTHAASVLKSIDGQRRIADEIGQVVSIADARVAHPFTKQGNRSFQSGYPAPDIPEGIVIHAVVGSVINTVVNKKGKIKSTDHTYSDGIIDVIDASAQYSDDWDIGGGVFVAECQQTFVEKVGGKHSTPFDDTCEHGNLLKSSDVQDDVLSAVQMYVNFINPAPVQD